MRSATPMRRKLVHLPVETVSQSALLTILLFTACTTPLSTPPPARTRFLMGTILSVSLQVDDPQLSNRVFDEIDRIENQITTWRESPFTTVNNSTPGQRIELTKELTTLLSTALDWRAKTGRAFDPFAGALIRIWDTRGEGRVPTQGEIANALSLLDRTPMQIDASSVIRNEGVVVEEGGFGKGYALDRAAELIRNTPHGRAILEFSGQISLIGDDDSIHAAIADPSDRSRPAVAITMPEGSISTSSGSERSFTSGGQTYSHLIDPRTGQALPPRGSATVFHRSALVADILSTALYVMGPDQGRAWAEDHQVAAIFITSVSDRWLVLPTTRAAELHPRSLESEFEFERK